MHENGDGKVLCKRCRVPVCLECWTHLHAKTEYKIPAALTNDNFQGYVHPFIVQHKVRWIEAVAACPFFSSLVTYYIEGKPKSRHNLAGEELGRLERAYGTRGNICSYMMPWEAILGHAKSVTTEQLFESWPQPPQMLAHMIRFSFKSTDENQCMAWLKELHIRAWVLVGLGRIYADHARATMEKSDSKETLLSAAEYFKRYTDLVEKHYPVKRFGRKPGDEGGLCDEIRNAVGEKH